MITRRRLIGTTAAGAVSLAAAGLAAPALAQGARIRVGHVGPRTGRLAALAAADDYNLAAFRAAAAGRDIEILARDSGSTAEGAAGAARALVAEGARLVIAGGGPETAGAVAAACAAAGRPSLTTGATWEAWLGAQGIAPADPGEAEMPAWGFHLFWGIEEVVAVFLDMWAALETNMVVAALFPDDPDGLAWGDPRTGVAQGFAGAGYRPADPGRVAPGTTDFAFTIGAFRRQAADLLAGVTMPADFAAFWTQARAHGFAPKVASLGKALLSPRDLEALGPSGHNLSGTVSWSPAHPFASSLTGQSSADLAADFTARRRTPWTQPLGVTHALLEVAADAMGRVRDPSDPEEVAAAIAATELATVLGPVAWDGAGVPAFAAARVARTPLAGGQWRRREDGSFDLVLASSPLWPEIDVAGPLEAMS